MPFAQDKTHGVASFYAPEGWLQRRATYRNGLLHGEASNYFDDGTLAELEHYRDGVREGPYRRFHPNGNVSLRAQYLRGQIIEPGQMFTDDGRPVDAQGKPMSRLRWWWLRWTDPQEV
ncbi:MORN repeat variant [compost metagenome]